MTERQLQQAIVDCARLLGWRSYHTFDSRRSEPGFPDLVLVRDRVVFAELKSERGRLTREQRAWAAALAAAGAEWHCWRPEDWTSGNVEAVLRARASERKQAA